jgi:hypothetical protein
MTNTNTAAKTKDTATLARNYAATIRRQSWSQTRAIERRIMSAEPVWTDGDNGDSEPWDWIDGEYAALYCLPKYGYIMYHRTGAGGSEAAEAEGGGYVGGSALYAVVPESVDQLPGLSVDNLWWEGVSEYLRYNAVELVCSRD